MGLNQRHRTPGARRSTGTEGRPAAARAGNNNADPAQSRRERIPRHPMARTGSGLRGSPASPLPGRGLSRLPPPRGAVPAGPPRRCPLGAALAPPRAPTAPTLPSRIPSRPGRTPGPTRWRMEADGGGDTHCTGSGAQDGGGKRPSGGRRDFRKENHFRGRGAAHFRPPAPPAALGRSGPRSDVPGHENGSRSSGTGILPRSEFCPAGAPSLLPPRDTDTGLSSAL